MPLFNLNHQPASHKRKKAYVINQELGAGGFGIVKEAIRVADGQHVAIKIVPKTRIPDMAMQIVRIEALSHFSHPHIVKLHEFFESTTRLYMVFELAAGGELYDHLIDLGRFGEEEARELAFALTDALRYLHSMGVIHRDIKLENILYRTPPGQGEGHGDCVISDFGLAVGLNETEDGKVYNIAGSPGYSAPEMYSNDGYGLPSDMWSLGVVIFCTMGGRFPYKATDPKLLAIEARTTELYFPSVWDDVSEEAKDFVRKLLTVDPAKRLTAEQAINHPWLRSAKSRPPSPDHPHALKDKPIFPPLPEKPIADGDDVDPTNLNGLHLDHHGHSSDEEHSSGIPTRVTSIEQGSAQTSSNGNSRQSSLLSGQASTSSTAPSSEAGGTIPDVAHGDHASAEQAICRRATQGTTAGEMSKEKLERRIRASVGKPPRTGAGDVAEAPEDGEDGANGCKVERRETYCERKARMPM